MCYSNSVIPLSCLIVAWPMLQTWITVISTVMQCLLWQSVRKMNFYFHIALAVASVKAFIFLASRSSVAKCLIRVPSSRIQHSEYPTCCIRDKHKKCTCYHFFCLLTTFWPCMICCFSPLPGIVKSNDSDLIVRIPYLSFIFLRQLSCTYHILNSWMYKPSMLLNWG